jgi:hypothetical protein
MWNLRFLLGRQHPHDTLHVRVLKGDAIPNPVGKGVEQLVAVSEQIQALDYSSIVEWAGLFEQTSRDNGCGSDKVDAKGSGR